MIFEGSEKKLEVVFKDFDLHTLDEIFWKELVATANATVLSEISNSEIKAYLLSESSLFVWHDRLTMITCGTTTLVNAIEYLFENIDRKNFEALIYQRKNEHFSHLQTTTFYEDVSRIRKFIPGISYRFGPKHEHHNFLFHSDYPFEANPNDLTSELLMYDIQGEASRFLTNSQKTKEDLRAFFRLDEILTDFEIDDFVFEPYGYSMNAIRGDKYCTIHVTPQEVSSYVSFETNLNLDERGHGLFKGLLEKLHPQSFDTVTFNVDLQDIIPDAYMLKTTVQDKIELGYTVTFRHYFQRKQTIEKVHKF